MKWKLLIVTVLFLSCTTMKNTVKQNPESVTHGYIAEGFEEVKEEFIRNFTKRGEIGASCCVYY